MAFELRGSKLIAIILLASGLDFLLFGCVGPVQQILQKFELTEVQI